MSRVIAWGFSVVAAIAVWAPAAHAQAVVSTRSGLVHFFEGAVFVAGQPLQAHMGKFTCIPEGSELRTEQGRAEVLLTPGVFLRVGEKSAIRMVASALADTRVELLAGSAIMDSAEPAAGTSVTLQYKDWTVRQPQKGIYRIDTQPAKIEAREGKVEVAAAAAAPVAVEQGMDMPLAAVLVPETAPVAPSDSLTDWADGRAQSISTDNAIAANIQDPGTMTDLGLPPDGFTYFPMLGLSSLGLNPLGGYGSVGAYSGLYGTSLYPYQAGFYSLYLPGYTYRPLFLRLPSSGLTHSFLPPYRTGLPITSPHMPTTRPITPAITHPAIHVGHR